MNTTVVLDTIRPITLDIGDILELRPPPFRNKGHECPNKFGRILSKSSEGFGSQNVHPTEGSKCILRRGPECASYGGVRMCILRRGRNASYGGVQNVHPTEGRNASCGGVQNVHAPEGKTLRIWNTLKILHSSSEISCPFDLGHEISELPTVKNLLLLWKNTKIWNNLKILHCREFGNLVSFWFEGTKQRTRDSELPTVKNLLIFLKNA